MDTKRYSTDRSHLALQRAFLATEAALAIAPERSSNIEHLRLLGDYAARLGRRKTEKGPTEEAA